MFLDIFRTAKTFYDNGPQHRDLARREMTDASTLDHAESLVRECIKKLKTLPDLSTRHSPLTKPSDIIPELEAHADWLHEAADRIMCHWDSE